MVTTSLYVNQKNKKIHHMGMHSYTYMYLSVCFELYYVNRVKLI